LLAEVYIRLTRGQNTLVIDHQEDKSDAQGLQVDLSVDLRSFELPVLLASGAEQEAHEKMLAELDKSSGGKTVWKNLMA